MGKILISTEIAKKLAGGEAKFNGFLAKLQSDCSGEITSFKNTGVKLCVEYFNGKRQFFLYPKGREANRLLDTLRW